ncbi:hypothetical protein OLX02_07385 [Novosphingobium sp. KCTC 2891]|uniref:hypothetical protein n=1 Tax=Novosphingobium sp. KCTC 2891 TaxID=2989730 RepID=UPI002223C9A1|nr:hypothetical protein [Novosphingobium sp. KCTC 2891]MCW1382643.1 hypothetical protein [Novosphingobium sp. KCTC 2891]
MGLLKRTKRTLGEAGRNTADTAKQAADAVPPPSPNPMTTVILADIALRAGGALLRRGVETGILGQQFGAKKAKKIIKGRSLGQTLVGTALARVATRSVPGAIVVGGGLLAKTLYDRRHAASQKAKGEEQVAEQAEKGKKA